VRVYSSTAPNVSPVFSSGTAGSGVAGTASSVYTAVATDADGGTLTYSLGSAVAGFTINASTGVVSMGASVVAGSYVLSVVVSDGTASVTRVVTVTVSAAPNVSPVFTSGLTGSGVAGVASSVYTAVATDADGGTLTYSLGSAVAGFTINSSTGVVSMGAGVVAGSYVLNVVVSDGTASVTRVVTVTVSAASNVSPVFSSGTAGSGVAGTASSVYTAVATDADGNPLTYSLGSAVAGFTINSSTGVVSMGAGVVAGSYVLSVVVSDGTASVTQVVTVTVSPAAVLARTGSDIDGLLTGALALLVLGLVAVAFTRRQEKGLPTS
jgi:serralysin